MKQYGYVACGIIASIFFGSSVYAGTTTTIDKKFDQKAFHANSIAALIQPQSKELPAQVKENLKNENKRITSVYANLQKGFITLKQSNALAKKSFTDSVSGDILISDSSVINISDAILFPGSATIEIDTVSGALLDNSPINFLNKQISDANTLLSSVTPALQSTLSILNEMRNLAESAASGTYGSAELGNLNTYFQSKLKMLNYVQQVDLLAGEKILSGGNIHISFSTPHTQRLETTNSVDIKIAAFDADSLGIDTDDIATPANAQTAIDDLDAAIQTVEINLVAADRIYDAESMLLSLPAMLVNDYWLLNSSLNLALAASNGTKNDVDRIKLDTYFDQVRKSMNQVQTYISLSGPIAVGAGDLHITIGDKVTDNNTLDIRLPRTDAAILGINQLSLKTQNSSYDAIDVLAKSIKEFIYTK